MDFLKRNKDMIIDLTFFIFAFVILWVIRGNIADVIGPFIISIAVAYLLDPLVSFLQKHKLSRTASILIVFAVIIGIIVGIFASFVPKLVNEILDFVNAFPSIVRSIDDFVVGLQEGTLPINTDWLNSFVDIDKELSNLSNTLIDAVRSITTSIISSTGKLLDVVMILIITFYYLKDKEKIGQWIKNAIPGKYKEKVGMVSKDISDVIGGFVRGQLIVAIFVGALTGIGCGIIGLPYSLTIGLVAGLTNVIPYFGPWLGGILPVALALINDPIKAVWVVIWIVIVQQVESNVLSPQIMSQSVGLHPLMVMFSVLLFGNIFGIVGMIIGVPIMGIIKVLVHYFIKFRDERNEINETNQIIEE